MNRILLSILFAVLIGATARSQEEAPHPELTWSTIETPHFLVHFHKGNERTAREVARVGEEIFGPITKMYQHVPDQKVSFIIRDHDDYSNGAAYFYENRIEIWAPSLDFELRGTHPWLDNVVTHEFTHIIQIQTAMKLGRKFPGVYLQWMGYEAERRPDVLYGYPNVIVSYPLSAFVVPSWFAEGVAQYNHPDIEHDYWDTHRDMILRMYMLDGNPLSWEEMAVFGKTSLGNESSYNAGYSIVDYIATVYGADKLEAVSRELASPLRVTIDGAIEAVIGKNGEQLYEEWKSVKTDSYRTKAAAIAANPREGEMIEKEGFGNFYPVFSPDQRTIAYISNRGKDYFGLSTVILYDRFTKTTQELPIKVRSSISFSRNGRLLYYSKVDRENPFLSKLSDIYQYDLEEKKEKRLTFGLRAFNPKVSPDGRNIAYAFGGDGTLNVGLVDSDGSHQRALTSFRDGEQTFTPCWSPDGRTIAFGFSSGHNQQIGVVDTSGSGLEILRSAGDARNPSYSADGRWLYYAWDNGGIFNIHRMDVVTKQVEQVTNVLGGAFLPSVDSSGTIAYASYTSSGYKIALMPGDSVRSMPLTPVAAGSVAVAAGSSPLLASAATEVLVQDPNSAAPPAVRSYRSVFTSLTVIPFLRFDNYNEKNSGIDILKPGFYFVSSEVLDKLTLFGGAAINKRYERDLFAILEFRDRLPLFYQLGMSPTISLELYNITRKTSVSFPLFTDIERTYATDVTYNLLEFDLTWRHPVFNDATMLKFAYTFSRYSADLGSFWVQNASGFQLSSAFSYKYLVGNIFSAQLTHDGIEPSRDKDINPVGRTVALRYALELNDYNKDFAYEPKDGILVPQFKPYNFHRLEGTWNEHLQLPIKHHTLSLGVRAGGIIGSQVDTIFHFYAGGLIGMRGYPFYAIDGNNVATVTATYRFPIATELNFRLLQFYFTKLYGSVFADLGNAWNGPTPSVKSWRRDAGFELRLESFSFYSYPTRIFVAGAYGFDQFTRRVTNVDVVYGKEWRFYLGVLFGFELNQLSERMGNFAR